MEKSIRDVFIVGATRTPIGAYLGALSPLRAPDLGPSPSPRRSTGPGYGRRKSTRCSWVTSSPPASARRLPGRLH